MPTAAPTTDHPVVVRRCPNQGGTGIAPADSTLTHLGAAHAPLRKGRAGVSPADRVLGDPAGKRTVPNNGGTGVIPVRGSDSWPPTPHHPVARSVLATLCCGLFALAGCALPGAHPRPAGTRIGRWRQDLHYLADNLPRLHKNAFHTISRRDFEQAVAALDARLPALDDGVIVVELARIVALIGDAHTRLELWNSDALHWFPFALRRFSDGTFVVRATKSHRNLLGSQLVGVGGDSLAQARQRIASVIPHENDARLNIAVPTYLRLAEVLDALGLSEAPGRAQFTFMARRDAGEATPFVPAQRSMTVLLRALCASDRPHWLVLGRVAGAPVPLWLQNRDKAYWFVYLEPSQTLYCAYNDCREMAGEPFADFAHRMLDLIDQRKVKRFVLDLRHNAGGDSGIARPLLTGLKHRPQINQTGRLFCLIGNRTASSALLNAVQLRRDTEAVFIGQPTGQKPNAYGEMRSFTLPNSGLVVTYPTRFFKLVPGDPPNFEPDIYIDYTFDDYLTGHDPALEAVLRSDGS